MEEKGYKFSNIAVNISPVQIKRSDFKDSILNTCAKYSIPLSLLEIEITEGTLMELCRDKIEVLNQLIEIGVNIAIDDFGTGCNIIQGYYFSKPLPEGEIENLLKGQSKKL